MGSKATVIVFLVCLCAAFIVAAVSASPATTRSSLKPPVGFAIEAGKAGNPLAEYVELLKHEQDYANSDEFRDLYYDIRGTRASFLGDQRAAQTSFDVIEQNHSPKPITKHRIDDMRPCNAAEYILSVADQHQVIMLSERHHVPQTRIVSLQLLQGLWDKGFRYLALETLDNRPATMDSKLNQRAYPTLDTGFYTQEPLFGEMVRQARKIGFKVIGYEAVAGLDAPNDPENPNKRQNIREREEAENVKKNILDKDPGAKIFVHCGMGHASKHEGKNPPGEKGEPWIAMARWFWQISGIEPYTIDEQSDIFARSKPELESGLYRYVEGKGLLQRPTIFVDKTDQPYTMLPNSYDVTIFLPRPSYVHGRPDWLQTVLGRTPAPIPERMLKGQGLQLVQAFYTDEPDNAVPVDQIPREAGGGSPGAHASARRVPRAHLG
jgi:hypothetical protein